MAKKPKPKAGGERRSPERVTRHPREGAGPAADRGAAKRITRRPRHGGVAAIDERDRPATDVTEDGNDDS